MYSRQMGHVTVLARSSTSGARAVREGADVADDGGSGGATVVPEDEEQRGSSGMVDVGEDGERKGGLRLGRSGEG